MKQLLSFFTGCLCLLLFSVTGQAQSGGKGRWSAGIMFSPDYSFRTLAFPDSAQLWKKFLDENDLPKFGYSAGICILYRLHSAFELESGLLYSNKGHRYKFPIDSQWHANDPAVPLKATTTYNYRYLDVPVKLNWYFLQKKVRLFLSAGLLAGIFIDEFSINKGVFPDRTETSRLHEDDVDFNEVTFSLSGGAGMEYPLSKHIFIRLYPEFRHAITPVADTSGKRYNWSVGINTGLYFRLRNNDNIIFAKRNNPQRF